MSIPQMIDQLAPDGLEITVWPCAGGFQASVKERAAPGWTCVTLANASDAVGQALRQRAARSGCMAVVPVEPDQIDIEEAIEATRCRYCGDTGSFYGDPELGPCGCKPAPVDEDLEGLLG